MNKQELLSDLSIKFDIVLICIITEESFAVEQKYLVHDVNDNN